MNTLRERFCEVVYKLNSLREFHYITIDYYRNRLKHIETDHFRRYYMADWVDEEKHQKRAKDIMRSGRYKKYMGG